MNWEQLPLSYRSAYIQTAVQNGLTNMQDIRKAYKDFVTGGQQNSPEDTFANQYKGGGSLNYSSFRNAMHKRGVTNDTHIKAIWSNIMVESRANYGAKNSKSTARGLLQWLKARQPKDMSLNGQLDYIAQTYNHLGGNDWSNKEAYQRFQKTKDPREAARLFRRYYERPEKSTWYATDKYTNHLASNQITDNDALNGDMADWDYKMQQLMTMGDRQPNNDRIDWAALNTPLIQTVNPYIDNDQEPQESQDFYQTATLDSSLDEEPQMNGLQKLAYIQGLVGQSIPTPSPTPSNPLMAIAQPQEQQNPYGELYAPFVANQSAMGGPMSQAVNNVEAQLRQNGNNIFKRGGKLSYQEWAHRLAQKWGEPDSYIFGDRTYDYPTYFKENYDDALLHLKPRDEGHFPDTYKTSLHPTFSDESRYSGSINKYNPSGIVGGHWSDNMNGLQENTYIVSPSQLLSGWNLNNTIGYLNDAEDNGVEVKLPNGKHPIVDGDIYGGILPAVDVLPTMFADGGSKDNLSNEVYERKDAQGHLIGYFDANNNPMSLYFDNNGQPFLKNDKTGQTAHLYHPENYHQEKPFDMSQWGLREGLGEFMTQGVPTLLGLAYQKSQPEIVGGQININATPELQAVYPEVLMTDLGRSAASKGLNSIADVADNIYRYADTHLGYYGNNLLSRAYGTVARRFDLPDIARRPELMRKLKSQIAIDEKGNVLLHDPNRTQARGIQLGGFRGDQGVGHVNFTTDAPVSKHSKGNWNIADLYIINPRKVFTKDSATYFKSVEPSDTFTSLIPEKYTTLNPKDVTIVTGNPSSIEFANQHGIKVLTNDKLKDAYNRILTAQDEIPKPSRISFEKPDKTAYNQATQDYADLQAQIQAQRGTPTLKDYQLMEDMTGLKAGVTDYTTAPDFIKSLETAMNQPIGSSMTFPKLPNGRVFDTKSGIDRLISRFNTHHYNKLFYDPATNAEFLWLKQFQQ